MATETRTTQLVVEVLTQPVRPELRVTQVVVELLTSLTVVAPPPERVQTYVVLPC